VPAAVRALRRSDELTRAGEPQPTSAVEILSAVQDAVSTGSRLRIGYVNASGATSDRIVAPLSLSGGYFVAFDEQSDERRTFSIARITALAAVPD
jgi:predicted DNA-binding transcriptional regulator YafY